MRIVAFLAARNERPYLRNCLSHLIANGIEYFIVDNDSDDGTADLLQEAPFARSLAGYRTYPFDGSYDWSGLLKTIEDAWNAIDADWIVFTAPDEILHSYVAGETLHDAIRRVDAAGYDVIDFDEFVFLPIDADYVPDADGPQPMRWYYFHDREKHMRARRKTLAVSLQKDGGHVLEGQPFALADETFALRHYMFRSQDHAYAKYTGRRFRQDELDMRWHGDRAGRQSDRFAFPPTRLLDYLPNPASRDLSRDRPRRQHYWLANLEPIDIVAFGPQPVPAGAGFNLQPSGESALWLRASRPIPRGMKLHLAGHELATSVRGDLATAIVPRSLTAAPGELPLLLAGPDGWLRSDPVSLRVVPA